MKRFLTLMLAFWLSAAVACAQAQPIATYILPEGADAQPVWNTAEWDIPEGLEYMYALMQQTQGTDNVYLVRMPNGRALVSVSSSTPIRRLSAQEMLDLWPQIAQNIANEGVGVDASAECASVGEEFGFEALRISTTIYLPDELALKATGAAFFRGEELLEVWAVAPQTEENFAQQQTEDLLAATAFLSSLDFQQDAQAPQGQWWEDPDGRFSMALPAGSTVLTIHSAQEELDQARAAYTQAHPEGAEALFDEYLKDIQEQRVAVIIAQDQQVVAEVFCSQEPDFHGMTAEDLALLAQPIRQSLAGRFDTALLLSAQEQTTISRETHAWLSYWLRSGENNVQLDVMAAVLEGDWLYEVDIYTHDGKQESRSQWFAAIGQTLQYTPPVNALDE